MQFPNYQKDSLLTRRHPKRPQLNTSLPQTPGLANLDRFNQFSAIIEHTHDVIYLEESDLAYIDKLGGILEV